MPILLIAQPAAAVSEDCPEGQVLHLSGCVDIDTVMVGDIQLSKAWARAGGAGAHFYFSILNRGEASDRLVGAAVSGGGILQLVHRGDAIDDGVRIDPGDTLELKPGGLHLSTTGLRFAPGDTIDVTLDFANAGPVVLAFPVRADEGI